MTTALRRPTTWVLAGVLILWAEGGVRCGDHYYPAQRTGQQTVIDR